MKFLKRYGVALLVLMGVASAIAVAQVIPPNSYNIPSPRVAYVVLYRDGGPPRLKPVLRKESDYRIGDRLVFGRGRMIVGKGKIAGFDRNTEAPYDMAVVEMTDFGYGIQPMDRAYITNRQDSEYSFDNFVMWRKESGK